jgi:hypothetical protein
MFPMLRRERITFMYYIVQVRFCFIVFVFFIHSIRTLYLGERIQVNIIVRRGRLKEGYPVKALIGQRQDSISFRTGDNVT